MHSSICWSLCEEPDNKRAHPTRSHALTYDGKTTNTAATAAVACPKGLLSSTERWAEYLSTNRPTRMTSGMKKVPPSYPSCEKADSTPSINSFASLSLRKPGSLKGCAHILV